MVILSETKGFLLIYFCSESFDDRESQEHLCRDLKGLASLKNLHIENLGFAEINEEGLEMVSEAFEELRSLNGLALDFVMCAFKTTEKVQGFHQALKKLSCLKALSLNFQRCHFYGKDAEVVASLSDALKELKSLTTLKLELDFK